MRHSATPKRDNFIQRLLKQRVYPHRVYVTKRADGKRIMGLITSNSYQDRDGEYITTQALKEWVDRQWVADDQYVGSNPLLFWHDEPAIGKVVYSEVSGAFLLELATEVNTPFAKAVWDAVEASPDEWGVSHGFEHHESEPRGDGRTYKRIDKVETSVLPLRYASNPYTGVTLEKQT